MHNFEVRMLGHIPRFGSLCHKWGSAWVPSSWKFHRNHWLSSRKLKKIMIKNYLSFKFFPFISRCRLSTYMIYKYIVQKSMIEIHVSILNVICSLWQEANFIRLNYCIYIYIHLFLKLTTTTWKTSYKLSSISVSFMLDETGEWFRENRSFKMALKQPNIVESKEETATKSCQLLPGGFAGNVHLYVYPKEYYYLQNFVTFKKMM